MKKLYFLTILMAIVAGTESVSADEPLDSTTNVTELEEVTVQGDAVRLSADKSVYYPDSKQRNAATDAVQLLQRMNITSLKIEPMSQSVSTLSGEAVSLFIDYLPASSEDVAGMYMKDVRSIEVLDYPTDPRFKGAKHVVNYIMQKYEWGGYTKLTTHDFLMDGDNLSSRVYGYSKFAYKKMSFDVNMNYSYYHYTQTGSAVSDIFHLPAFEHAAPDGTVHRDRSFTPGLQISNSPSVNFRAVYNTEKVQISNRLSYNYSNTPKSQQRSSLVYTPQIIDADEYDSQSKNRSNTVSYSGNFNFNLPHDWSISFSPYVSHTHTNKYTFYQESELPAIENNIRDNSLNIAAELNVLKTFGKHNIGLGFGEEYGNSRLIYAGSTNMRSKLYTLGLAPMVSYRYSADKFNVGARIGVAFLRTSAEDIDNDRVTPEGGLDVSWSPNSHNRLNVWLNTGIDTPHGAQMNPTVIQSNMLEYTAGNPDLHSNSYYNMGLYYTWVQSQTFSLSAYAGYYYANNVIGDYYSPYDDGRALLIRPENIGGYASGSFSLNASLSLLNNKLNIYAGPNMNIQLVTGKVHQKATNFGYYAQAIYYFGSFSVLGYYQQEAARYTMDGITFNKYKPDYGIQIGWGQADWKLNVSASNFFRGNWREQVSTLRTPVFERTMQTYGISNHSRVQCTIVYTFGYGKKINRGDELGTASGGSSSIR